METYNSRLVFLDSTNNSTGTGIAASFPVNDTDNFTAQGNNKTMRVGLNSFSMYRNFYNINPTNNTFIFAIQQVPNDDGSWVPYTCQIPIGDYSHFTYDASCNCNNPERWETYLDEAIAAAICAAPTINPAFTPAARSTNTHGTVECIFNTRLRIFEIYIARSLYISHLIQAQIFFLTIKSNLITARDKTWVNTSSLPSIEPFNEITLFQDTYQIMGGRTNYTGTFSVLAFPIDTQMFINYVNLNKGYKNTPVPIASPIRMPTSGATVLQILSGTSVAQLSTLDEVVIRTNMPSQNYQSPGVDQTIPTNLGLSPTNILAKIPIDDTTFDEKRGIIHFIDHNNNFLFNVRFKYFNKYKININRW